ncbi:MAG TPA: HD domain-containing protein [Bacilli bacterium]|nr:HD domain-containing protein [Bacilli bacterium]
MYRILELSKLKDYFITSIKNINSNLYLNSEYHGKSHAERVCLYAYLISNYINLPEDQIRNVIIASLLHDIGKTHEYNKDNHGYNAVKKIGDLSVFIDSNESINEIKFLIEAHSLDRNSLSIIDLLKKYNISNINSCLKTLNVLMDADALDRTRFDSLGNNYSKLDSSYLRIPVSHRLVDISRFISQLYYDKSSKVLIKK